MKIGPNSGKQKVSHIKFSPACSTIYWSIKGVSSLAMEHSNDHGQHSSAFSLRPPIRYGMFLPHFICGWNETKRNEKKERWKCDLICQYIWQFENKPSRRHVYNINSPINLSVQRGARSVVKIRHLYVTVYFEWSLLWFHWNINIWTGDVPRRS